MNNLPLVSVIIPCYNVEKYIRRCIKTLLANDYDNKELIFIDDESKDNTYKILLELKDLSYIKIIHQKNGGVSNARNTGLKIASGQYIMFVDPDDYVSSNFISKAVREITKEQNDMLMFGFYIKNPNEDKESFKSVLPKESYHFQNNEEILKKLFPKIYGYSLSDFYNYLKGNRLQKNFETGQVWRWIYKKSFLDNNNIRFIEKRHGEDTTFNSECLLYANSIKSIKDCLYYYLPRPDGLMLSTINGKNLLMQKENQLEERIRLGKIYSQKTKYSYLDNMAGSNILSCYHIASVLSRENNYVGFKKYIQHKEIKESISKSKIYFKNYKLAFPFLLLKIKAYKTFFFLFKLMNYMNFNIEVGGKIKKSKR